MSVPFLKSLFLLTLLWPPKRYRRWQRSISSVLLMGLLVAIVGVPVSPPAKQPSTRFPCEQCGCGCSSAEHCWDQCCCHTDTEKLRWAADNDVTPPDFLVARVAARCDQNPLSTQSSTIASAGCCCNSREPTCDVATNVEPKTDTETVMVDQPQRGRLIRLENVAKCRGIQLLWSVFSGAIVPLHSSAVAIRQPPLLYHLPIRNEFADSLIILIDPPVPWLALS